MGRGNRARSPCAENRLPVGAGAEASRAARVFRPISRPRLAIRHGPCRRFSCVQRGGIVVARRVQRLSRAPCGVRRARMAGVARRPSRPRTVRDVSGARASGRRDALSPVRPMGRVSAVGSDSTCGRGPGHPRRFPVHGDAGQRRCVEPAQRFSAGRLGRHAP